MTEITQTPFDTGRRMSIAWPFFLRLPRCFRLDGGRTRPRVRETPARLRSKIERDMALFEQTAKPLLRATRH